MARGHTNRNRRQTVNPQQGFRLKRLTVQSWERTVKRLSPTLTEPEVEAVTLKPLVEHLPLEVEAVTPKLPELFLLHLGHPEGPITDRE